MFTSTEDQTFLSNVRDLFTKNERVFVLIQYAYGAGSRDFMLLKNFEEFQELMQKNKERDAVSVMKAFHPIMENSVKKSFIEDAVSKFRKNDHWILIGPDNFEYTSDWAYAESLSELKEELQGRMGRDVCIVEEPNTIDASQSFTAYIPDADGKVRPGAY